MPVTQVSAAALATGYGTGLSLVAANRYLNFSDEPLAFAALGFTGFSYAFFSMYIYGEFRYCCCIVLSLVRSFVYSGVLVH